MRRYLATFLLLASSSAFALTETVDGIEWRYTVSGGQATVAGDSYSSAIPTSVSGNLIIPSMLGGYPVSGIGNNAFKDCNTVYSIEMPDTITTIGYQAFSGCSSLTSITIPVGVTSIGNYSFSGCSSLTSITIPEGVTSIGNYTFSGCSSLTSITIPKTVTSIGDYTFHNCRFLSSVMLSASLTSIGNSPFYSSGVSDVYISIEDIRQWCTNVINSKLTGWRHIMIEGEEVTQLAIPNGVASIGNSAFYGCGELKSINFPESVTSIGSASFGYCTGLTSISIPMGVTNVSKNAFADCSNLSDTYIAISNLTSWLETSSHVNANLSGCRHLLEGGEEVTYINIPDGVTGISGYAFSNCTNITSITISDTVTSIGYNAFYMCSRLSSMVIPDSVTKIGQSAFNMCSGLTSVIIPDSVTSIGKDAFRNCSNINSIAIPNNVARIESGTFDGCTGLTSIMIGANLDQASLPNIPVNVQVIEVSPSSKYYSEIDGVLFNKTKTELIRFPKKRIGAYSVPDCVSSIRSDAFASSRGLTSIVLPESVHNVGFRSFINCSNLFSIIVDSGAVIIGTNAFENCYSLSRIAFSGDISSIGANAFLGCDMEKTILVPISSVPDAFSHFTHVTNCVVTEGSFVRNGMFSNLSELKSLTFPSSILTMDGGCFTDSPSLREVHFLGDAPEVTGDLYATQSRRLTTYVPEGSIGWDGGISANLPETWQGRAIRYESSGGTGGDGGSWGQHDDNPASATETLNGVTWVYVPDGNGGASIIGSSAETTPDSFSIPSSLGGSAVHSIGEYAFAGLPRMVSVAIPEGVVTIGTGAFERNVRLASVSLPSTLTSIGDSAFRECVSLTSIDIPAAVTNIGYFAFRDCLRLGTVNYLGEPPHCDLGAWDRVPAFAIQTDNGGFSVVVTDILGSGAVAIPEDWALQYPLFAERFGSDFATALTKDTGKTDANGNALQVWQDYVAGTDPTNPDDRFTATIAMENGSPVIEWIPKLSDTETAKRKYTVWGKTSLSSTEEWAEVSAGEESLFNFFRVTVEMR